EFSDVLTRRLPPSPPFPYTTLFRSGSYWAPPQPEDGGATRYAAASEEVMELQRRLIDDQLAALQPQRRGVTDLYFIGFAPYASEDRKSTRLNSSHVKISYAVFCLKK